MFFEKYFVALKLLLKIVLEKRTVDSYAYKPCYCPGRIYIELGPLALWDFCNIFLPNAGEDQKTSYLSAGPLVLSHMLNSSLVNGYCITLIKRLDEGLSKQLLGQSP